MFHGHTITHIIALFGISVFFVGCTSSSDEEITRKVPRGYQRAHNITTESWETRADGALAVSEEVPLAPETVAESTLIPPQNWEPVPAKPSIVAKLKRKSLKVARLTYRAANKVARAARGARGKKPRVMARAVVR